MPTTTLYACLQFAIISGTHPHTWRNNSGSVGIARNWKMAKKWPKLGKDCIFWAPTTLYCNAIMSILSPLSNHYVQTMCQEVQFWIKRRWTVQDSQWSLEITKTHSKQRFLKFFWLPPSPQPALKPVSSLFSLGELTRIWVCLWESLQVCGEHSR